MTLSCLIPVHTHIHLQQCLNSLVEEVDEILLFINGDLNKSETVINRLISEKVEFQKIRIIEKKEDAVGSQVARNELFDACSSEHILFMDCDDYRISNKLREQLSYLKEFNWEVCIGHPIFLWKDPQAKTREVYQEKQFPLCKDIWHLLIKRCLQTGCILWRRSALQTVKTIQGGELWKTKYKRLQEYRLVIAALNCCLNIGLFPGHVSYYRWNWNPAQISQNKENLQADSLMSYYEELREHVPQTHKQFFEEFVAGLENSLNKLKDPRMTEKGTLIDWEQSR
jgi:glycosyltransferase involved in cell wall biosynthesis